MEVIMQNITAKEAAELVREGNLLSPGERLEKQKERLTLLVNYVREHSPCLKELYRDLPEDFSLSDLPVTTKEMMLSSYDEWVTDRELTLSGVRKYLARDETDTSLLLGKYTALQTSGSTGNPLPMVRDSCHNLIHGAMMTNRLAENVDMEIFDLSKHKRACVIHVSPSASSYGAYLRTRKANPDHAHNIMAVDVAESIEEITAKLNEFQPEALTGYPPSLVLLAEEKAKGNLNIPLKIILSSAELLTSEAYERITSVFGCPILNNYCMTEGGEIAMTRGCSHLHINEDFVIVEPVDENRYVITDSSEYSDGILVTDLTNYVQPVIRYYVSDSVRIIKNIQGCNDLPVLDIRGRTWDSYTIGGRTFTTKGLEVEAKFIEGLCQYQFIQTGENSMEVRGVTAAGLDPEGILRSFAEREKTYFEGAGCPDVTVTWSSKPLIHNKNGGKVPMFIKAYK